MGGGLFQKLLTVLRHLLLQGQSSMGECLRLNHQALCADDDDGDH